MSDHELDKIIPELDAISYYAGITMAFAEVVGAGCKKLALSTPYSYEMAQKMIPISQFAANIYNVKIMAESDLLVTKLFPRDIAQDKIVILIAYDQSVLDEYEMLKKLKIYSDEEGNPENLEIEISQRFGSILSYNDDTIKRLIIKNG
jgi:hypothetical protein